jgi:general secretion pathway protein G
MSKERKRLWLTAGLAVVLILALLIGTQYRAKMQTAREDVLRLNLQAMRDVIDYYIVDKHQPPQSLQQLVDAGYLRELPVDPMTNSNSKWTLVMGNVVVSPGQTVRGITDVHSSSSSISSNGTIYSAW